MKTLRKAESFFYAHIRQPKRIYFTMQKLKRILPISTFEAITKLDFERLQEIRLRTDKPVSVLYGGKKYFLCSQGLTLERKKALTSDKVQVENALLAACEHSMHSYAEQMSKGFLAPFDGVRIGVCGTAVKNNGEITAFKDVVALNIRLPHRCKNCSEKFCSSSFFPHSNVLVISSPGRGKTTFLRDMIFQTSLFPKGLNILVADERNEIAGMSDGKSQFDLGERADVITFADKGFAFSCGVRTMTPDIVACDEIDEKDLISLFEISSTGVNIYATMHGKNLEDLKSKISFEKIKKIFDCFVFLSDDKLGEIAAVYDKNLALQTL